MNSNSKQLIIPHQFSDKCVALLYFIALVPCSLKLLMGINARIGISEINPFLKALLLFIPAILGFRSLYKELKWWDFLVVTGIIWFVYWSPNLYPQTTIAVLEFAPYFLIYCLPYYLVGASINISQQRGLFYHIGYYGLIINIIICALAVGGIAKKMFGEENNMELAYGILPSLILVVMNALNNKSRKDFALSVIGTLLIFALGSRGALLSLLFFISGDLILFKKYLNPVAARIRIIISAVVIGE